jgi:chromosome segregation ATPase
MKFIILLLLAGIGYSGFWNYQFSSENKKLSNKISKLENDLNKMQNQKAREKELEEAAIRDLDGRIQALSAEISSLTDRLKGINDVELGGNNPATREWDINQEKQTIANLEKQQDDLKYQENSTSSEGKKVVGQDKIAKAQAETAMQSQILSQQQVLISLQQQLSQAKKERIGGNTIQNLQNQVSAQQNYIASLKIKKQDLANQWNETTQGHQNYSATVNNLKADENNLKARIAQEKKNLSDLQKGLNSDKDISKRHKQDLEQIQGAIKGKMAQLEELKSQRASHQQKLNQLGY